MAEENDGAVPSSESAAGGETDETAADRVSNTGYADGTDADGEAVAPGSAADLARSAEEARMRPPARQGRNPANLLILACVLASVFVVGAWFFVYSAHVAEQNGRIRLRILEEKQAAYDDQADWIAAHHGKLPNGDILQPLPPADAAQLQDLRRRFHVPPKPQKPVTREG